VQESLLALLPPRPYQRILDPACGTGEFLLSAARRFPAARLEGWEVDRALCEIARTVAPSATIRCCDALRQPGDGGRFDLVLGNPPYFECRLAAAARGRFAPVLSGRPNVFALFFHVGLSLLAEGGVLAFVVPQSMNNGAYFRRLREHILSLGAVIGLRLLPDESLFHAARQTVMLIVVRKGARDDRFVFRRGGITVFSEAAARLAAAFEGRVTLADLGLSVKTGSVVWNQHKPRLTSDPDAGTPLLWARNIGREGLAFPLPGERRQYIRTTGLPGAHPDRGPALVVNRVTGVGPRASLRCALVPAGFEFFAENHVNVVSPAPTRAGRNGGEEAFLGKVGRALRSPEAIEAARLLTGNTQISKTELERLVPLPLPGPSGAS